MTTLAASRPDFATLRQAGKEVLSLALIDTRNQSLRWASAFESAFDGRGLTLAGLPLASIDAFAPPLWTLGHLAWFPEYWIARNVQRSRGEQAAAAGPRLAPLHADADHWYRTPPALSDAAAGRVADTLPGLAATRQYLVDTLETTLDLLDAAPGEDDASLFFFRLAVFHESAQIESFAALAQAIGFDSGLVGRAAAAVTRAPLAFQATRWLLGASGAGFSEDDQRPAHPVDVPEFEIDAQAVTWAQYGEFVEDGGYDDPRHWSAEGRDWLAREGRRTPRYVEQMRHGVLQRRFGTLTRLPPGEPVAHVGWHEAEAWCRWAGRRLPDEAEWEAAAHQGATRGFRHGEVHEWMAGRYRPYPGYTPAPWRAAPDDFTGRRVLRGASFATPVARRSRRLRHAVSPDADAGFVGFRSCAV